MPPQLEQQHAGSLDRGQVWLRAQWPGTRIEIDAVIGTGNYVVEEAKVAAGFVTAFGLGG